MSKHKKEKRTNLFLVNLVFLYLNLKKKNFIGKKTYVKLNFGERESKIF